VTREALAGMRTDIDQLLGRVGTIDIAIRRHDDQLTAHQACIEEHRQRFLTLEQKVTIPLAQPMALRHIVRHTPENNLCLSPHCTRETPVQHFDIGRFTEQEKRVLAVFFQNKGMRMSYADLARVLNKSTYTVKNQMNQIRQKADLFECTIGDQSRNLFTLKADLRVEKYLKVGQPIERPVSIPERDQSEVESEAKEAEPVVEYVHERSEAQEED
jgi:DNA-binding CsgD family transcriptional regulator